MATKKDLLANLPEASDDVSPEDARGYLRWLRGASKLNVPSGEELAVMPDADLRKQLKAKRAELG